MVGLRKVHDPPVPRGGRSGERRHYSTQNNGGASALRAKAAGRSTLARGRRQWTRDRRTRGRAAESSTSGRRWPRVQRLDSDAATEGSRVPARRARKPDERPRRRDSAVKANAPAEKRSREAATPSRETPTPGWRRTCARAEPRAAPLALIHSAVALLSCRQDARAPTRNVVDHIVAVFANSQQPCRAVRSGVARARCPGQWC